MDQEQIIWVIDLTGWINAEHPVNVCFPYESGVDAADALVIMHYDKSGPRDTLNPLHTSAAMAPPRLCAQVPNEGTVVLTTIAACQAVYSQIPSSNSESMKAQCDLARQEQEA